MKRLEKILLVIALLFALTMLAQGVYYIFEDLAKLEQQRLYILKSL